MTTVLSTVRTQQALILASSVMLTFLQCGFTPQYSGLEKLQQKYKDQGFTVLGFPCNQFGEHIVGLLRPFHGTRSKSLAQSH